MACPTANTGHRPCWSNMSKPAGWAAKRGEDFTITERRRRGRRGKSLELLVFPQPLDTVPTQIIVAGIDHVLDQFDQQDRRIDIALRLRGIEVLQQQIQIEYKFLRTSEARPMILQRPIQFLNGGVNQILNTDSL